MAEKRPLWAGIQDKPGYPAQEIARDVRNYICQLKHRRKFAEGVTGDYEDCIKKMIASILKILMDIVGAPRGGLAVVIDIHETRMASFLDQKRWPKHKKFGRIATRSEPTSLSHRELGAEQDFLADVREVFLSAMLWMFVGDGWREKKAAYVNTRTGQVFLDVIRSLSAEQRPDFLKTHYAYDIRDYFFPFDSESIFADYFRPFRLHWISPWDGRELAIVFQWVRRAIKAKPDRVAYIAIFIAEPLKAQALLRSELMMSELAFGPAESKGRLRVDFFLPSHGPEGQDNVPLAQGLVEQKLRSYARGRCEEWGVAFHERPADENCPEIVKFYPESRETVPSVTPALRAIVAFMFLGYFFPKDEPSGRGEEFSKFAEDVPHERLYLLRPMLTIDEMTPLSMEFASQERHEFLNAASTRYLNFSERLTWFRSRGGKK